MKRQTFTFINRNRHFGTSLIVMYGTVMMLYELHETTQTWALFKWSKILKKYS